MATGKAKTIDEIDNMKEMFDVTPKSHHVRFQARSVDDNENRLHVNCPKFLRKFWHDFPILISHCSLIHCSLL